MQSEQSTQTIGTETPSSGKSNLALKSVRQIRGNMSWSKGSRPLLLFPSAKAYIKRGHNTIENGSKD